MRLPNHELTETEAHGGPDLEELRNLGIDPSTLLDFSVCTNPFGPSPRVREAVVQVPLDQYPDREAYALRAALADRYGLPPSCILAGNGASELIWLTAALLGRGDRALVIGPTYGEYARSAVIHGAHVSTLWTMPARCISEGASLADATGLSAPARCVSEGASLADATDSSAPARCVSEGGQHAPSVQDIDTALCGVQPRMLFLCNPNNPTGAVLPPELILAWVTQHPETLFVVDEAYQGFVPGLGSLMHSERQNLVVLRSMTKDCALAGLRVGYVVASAEIIAKLIRLRPPWSVNALAQTAAVAALRDDAHLAWSMEQIALAKTAFVAGLTTSGLEVWPSATHYFLVHVGDGAAFRLRLLKKGFLVRDAASFGLPAFIRLATRRPEDNDRLLAALREGP